MKMKMKHFENSLKEYPAIDHLYNALYFIEKGIPDEAFPEICYAIKKAGGVLLPSQIEYWRKLINGKTQEDKG